MVTEFARVGMRLLLVAIFLIAGVAKLANPRETVQTLHDFGVPRRLQPFGVLLPAVETAVAVGLLFARTAWFAAVGACALLVLFIAGIGVNLARGRQPACNCFGQLHSRPIGRLTLLRNGVLAAGASWLVASGPPDAGADLWVVLVGLDSRGRRVATVVAAVVSFMILRALWPDEPDAEPVIGDDEPENPSPIVRPPTTVVGTAQAPPTDSAPASVLSDVGLAVGSPAPGFVLPDIEGEQHDLDTLRAHGTPVLLIFSNPFCESCQVLMPKLPGLAAQYADALRLVVVSRGTAQQNLAKMKGPWTLPILLQKDSEVAAAYDCGSTPAAVLVGTDGAVHSLLAVGGPAIVKLMATAARSEVTSSVHEPPIITASHDGQADG